MTPLFARPPSLRGRILLATGGTVSALLMTIFVVVLLVWRARSISDLEQDSLAVSRAFSVSVLETLVAAEGRTTGATEQLDEYIEHLMRDNGEIRSVAVLDPSGSAIASSDAHRGADANRTDSSRGSKRHRLSSAIYESPRWGWVIETNLPLRTGEKEWGLLEVLYDAEATRKELTTLFAILSLGTLCTVAAVLAVLYILAARETRPLTLLASGLDKLDIEAGGGPALPESGDEIGSVIRQFNRLRGRLSQSRAALVSAQRQIYHAEKLASIGRLASGIAHEVNNPLTGIKSCLYSIRKEPENHALTAEYLELIAEGIERIEGVVQKLLGFARQSERTAPVRLNEEIPAVLSLLSYRLDQADIQVNLELDPNLPEVSGEPALLQEVVMNLVLNAFDAVRPGGKVTIRTACACGEVRVEVEDDGCGIAEEDLEKIFDPFFTTKDPGKGTGLGLSVALGIAEAHGASLTVRSRFGEGACFTLRFPPGSPS